MHVARACAIGALRNQRGSLKTIHAQLSVLSEAELAALQPAPDPRQSTAVAAPPSATPHAQAPLPPRVATPAFQSWEVATRMPGLVLLVCANADAALKSVAEAIFRTYARVE